MIKDRDDLERSWGKNAHSPRISRMLSSAVTCFLHPVLDSQLSTSPLPSEKMKVCKKWGDGKSNGPQSLATQKGQTKEEIIVP